MLIDWFTIIAQLINFLVLVWLLKRFLYRPILNAIDAREKRIVDELADAEHKRVEAEQQRKAFEQKNAEFDKQRMTKMKKVDEDVKDERTRLLDAARQDADALRGKLELAVKNEQLSLQDALSRRAMEEVFAIVRKALNDLTDTGLETRMAGVFVKRLAALSDDEKASLQSAFKDSDQPLIVHTAFDLAEEEIVLIKTALNKILTDSVEIKFVSEPNVISGIEIQSHGQKIGWSMADYLATLIKHVNEVMTSHSNSDTTKNIEQGRDTDVEKKQGQVT